MPTTTIKKKFCVQCRFCEKIYKSPSLYQRHMSYCKKNQLKRLQHH